MWFLSNFLFIDLVQLLLVPKPVPEFKVLKQSADIKSAMTNIVLEWKAPDPRGRPVTDFEVQKVGYFVLLLFCFVLV